MSNYFYRTRMHQLVTEELIDGIIGKYHYNESDRALLVGVSRDLISCIRHSECLEIVISDDATYADAAVTLGQSADALITRYEKEGKVLNQLMIDNLCQELLAKGYLFLIERVCERLEGRSVSAMHFWGGEEGYPIEGLKKVAGVFRHIMINVTDECYIIPSKSIICRVETVEADANGEDVCTDWCSNCSMRGKGSCRYGNGK